MIAGLHLERIRGHTLWTDGLKPESVVVDAGAHRGEFSRVLRDRFGCRCHLIEANPELAAQLKREPFASVLAAALAAKDGTTAFRKRDNPECGGIFPLGHDRGETCVSVETVTLQTLMRRQAVSRIDVLKLDIEGVEFDLLESAPAELLDSAGQITVEFHDFLPEFKGRRLYERAKQRLQSLGFFACRMTFRAHGDVLLLNRRIFPLRAPARLWLQHMGRWALKFKAHSSLA